jgi:hypothetical protein
MIIGFDVLDLGDFDLAEEIHSEQQATESAEKNQAGASAFSR